MPIQPRSWQQDFLAKYHANTDPDFLCVACPGAGKTYAAAFAAADLLQDGTVSRILVVAPSTALRKQWHSSFAKLGIYLDFTTMNNTHGEMATLDGKKCSGWIVTYASLDKDCDRHRKLNLATPTMAILDEVHHLSDNGSWGKKAVESLGGCIRRLALSGTPFRTDGNSIPFTESVNGWARYKDGPDGIYPRGFDYSYGKALADRPAPVRPMVFEQYDSDVEWFDGFLLEQQKVRVSDNLKRAMRSKANRYVLEPSGHWMQDTLAAADQRLEMVRQEGDTKAKGLVICSDTQHAAMVAKILGGIVGADAVSIATSKNEDGDEVSAAAIKTIETFGESGKRWLVAVAMVSEGVDIPQLRVGVYATTYRSELFFSQVLGRFVRVRDDIPAEVDQTAYLFVPKDPQLVALADKIAREVENAIFLPDDGDDDEDGDEKIICGGGWQPPLNFDAFISSTSEQGGILVPGHGTFDHSLVEQVVGATGKNAAVVIDVLRAAQMYGATFGEPVAPQTAAAAHEPTETYAEKIKARKGSLEKALKQIASVYQRTNGGEFGKIIAPLKHRVYAEAGITDYQRADLPEIERALKIAGRTFLELRES